MAPTGGASSCHGVSITSSLSFARKSSQRPPHPFGGPATIGLSGFRLHFHIAMALLFLGFVTVLSVAFATSRLLVPYGVFAFLIVAYFAVPAMWARMKPEENRARALSWDELLEDGVQTATGRASGGEAAVLVLMLPAFVLLWAIAVATIAYIVR